MVLPLINQTSHLPSLKRRRFATEQYTQYSQHLTNLTQLLTTALNTVAADRASLEKKAKATPVKQGLTVHYGEPRHWEFRLSHPLARTLFFLLQDLVQLDEQWAAYAWNAEAGKGITPDFLLHSELNLYEQWQQERLQWVRELSKECRLHLKTLRQALSQPRAA